MKILSLNSFLSVAGAASSVLLPAFNAAGQTTVATTPVGYLQTSCLSSSDTLVAPPFTRPAAFTGAVSSTSGNVITLSSASLTADAYDAATTTPPTKDTYYLTIGPATATLTGTVSVTSGSTTVTGTGTTFGTDVNVGDRITINDGTNLLTYTVTAIASATSLTIDRAYSDSAATGSTSAITPVSATASKGVATAVKTTTGRVVVAATPAATTKSVVTAKLAATTKAVASTSTATLSGLSATYDHSPYEGRWYAITSNGTSTVTVNLNGDTLSSVAAGTQVSVIPYWNLDSVFPASNVGISFTASSSPFARLTQIFIPDYSSKGTNLAAAATYYFLSSGSNVGWRLYGDSTTNDHGYDPLLPDGYFTVRTDSSAPTLPVTFTGTVPINKQVATLATNTSSAQDNAVGLTRPADTTLNALGLNPSNNSFLASPSVLSLTDQLFVYNNNQVAINKAANATYYYISSGSNVGWRLYGDSPATDHGTDVVPAGSALTIRKAAASGTTANPVWTNLPNY